MVKSKNGLGKDHFATFLIASQRIFRHLFTRIKITYFSTCNAEHRLLSGPVSNHLSTTESARLDKKSGFDLIEQDILYTLRLHCFLYS